MKQASILSIIVLNLFLGNYANAAWTVGMYERLKIENKEWVELYVAGLGNGYSWANNELRSRGSEPLYCPPKALALNSGNRTDIIDNGIASYRLRNDKKVVDKLYIGLFLLDGLIDSFPCK